MGSPIQSGQDGSYLTLFAYWTTVNYREAYHLHASNGILFNSTVFTG